MTVSLKRVGAITLFVDDPQQSKRFYESVFDTTVIYEDENFAAFWFENMIVNLLSQSAARDLIDPARCRAGDRFALSADRLGR